MVISVSVCKDTAVLTVRLKWMNVPQILAFTVSVGYVYIHKHTYSNFLNNKM